MPLVRPGYLAQTPPTTFALGKSDTISRQRAFGSSPFNNGFDDGGVRLSFSEPPELSGRGFDAVLSDGGYMFGSVSRYYPDAPDLNSVEVGGAGKPGSPWAPNIASPGEGNGLNPSSIPAVGVGATFRAKSDSAAYNAGNLISPINTTRGIVPRTLGTTLSNGVGSGDTFRIRII